MKITIRSSIGEWLSPIDAFWSCQLILRRNHSSGLEIGVYKGGWTTLILDNFPLTSIVGIDPYPGLFEIRSIMETETSKYSAAGRFFHYETIDSCPAKPTYDFIHIDGEHSEEAVMKDLLYSYSKLNDGGMIIIDDFMSRMFPGITAQTILLAFQLDLKPVLITQSKIYLVKNENWSSYYNDVLEISKKFATGDSGTYKNGLHGESYFQNGKVLGVKVYVQPPLTNWKIRNLLEQKAKMSDLFKSARYFLTPPIFQIFVSLLLKAFKIN
jgi:hypothetical protein